MPGAPLTLYHGTDVASAVALLNGQSLDPATAAARKLDGGPGFYLATHADDAAYFALRRGHRRAAVVRAVFTERALEQLAAVGSVLRPIPHSAGSPGFAGRELRVLPDHFALFDALRRSGDVVLDQE